MRQEYIPDCTFGKVRLAINTMEYKEASVAELHTKVLDVYRRHMPIYRHPMLEEETEDEWKARVQPLLDKEKIRKKGESVEDHQRRLFSPSGGDTHKIAFEIVTAIASVFQPKVVVSPEDYKEANWLKIKLFLFDILNLADIPCDEFIPKRPIGIPDHPTLR